MVFDRATRPQQPSSLTLNRGNLDEESHTYTLPEATPYHDRTSNEMDTLAPVADRTLLVPKPRYSRRNVARSQSEYAGGIQARRKHSPSPSRASTFLRKISSRAPKSPRSPHFLNFNLRGDQYEHLDNKDPEYEQDPIGVDLSSLVGLGFELMPGPEISISHVSESQQSTTNADQGDHSEQRRGLGDGMIVGAQLRLDPSMAAVRAQSLRHLTSASAANEMQRAKSIREAAQDLAQRTNKVVAVDDPSVPPTPEGAVDLSLLEGTERRRRTNTTFNKITPNSQTTATNTRSYFYPDDPNPPNWKPITMSPPYILLLIIISLALAAVQEWLCQLSMRLEAKDDGILSFSRVADVPIWSFFCWKYLPTLIFVIYGVLWQIMDFEIKRLEPYYQLSKPLGSTAAQSLNLDHLSLWSYLVPFKAFRLRQWAVFCSAVGNLLTTSVCPSLQNPSIRFDQNCEPGQCQEGRLPFSVRIDPGWSRVLTSFLVITAILGMVLFVQLRRKSGLLSDPKGIAGIAAMATKSHILNDFQGMDLATHRQIHSKLRHRRYLLNKSSIWQGEYDKSEEPKYEGGRNLESPHPMMLRLSAGIPFISFLAFCLVAVPIINFTGARIIPNTAPWLPILIATVIKIVWTTFEFDVRMTEPFYTLSKGNAPPEMSLTLDYQGTVYGWFPIKALINRHYIVALVGFSSMLADALTVTVSSFSVNGAAFLSSNSGDENASSDDETFRSFWGSVVLSIVILIFLILSAALVYALRRHPFLPRQPSTIAAVLAFIHASKMLDDFIDTERLSNKDMERKLKEKGKKYGLGWFKGRDRQWHCAIDEEPMRSKYVHGVSYTMAQEPWHGGNGGVGGGVGYDFMRYDP
ncbi:hypothetical protein EPUS_00105 [Endocarpon pusillum Z07020]|uniref:Uncharacterized protein n=1 Tax=Endocarpon pusillum (strain Z07020 / HMAS-L-300199) TaxID=1263415 RepID=U1GSF4_ENDPU|nr:uncharacterized protein EPUS_00105 [Endocarpon pusillum Z07020]ERF75313.1 hypothetical protein EPUS_00105 [Endocarpon pusillum Z07020]